MGHLKVRKPATQKPGQGVFVRSLAPDRPDSGGFAGIIPGNPVSTSVGETRGFKKRKTGLFSALWIEYLRPLFRTGYSKDDGQRKPPF